MARNLRGAGRLLVVVALAAAAVLAPIPAAAAGGDPGLSRYAADTWRSLSAMVEPATGLPADNIGGSLDPGSRSRYTSPTNIGVYLWSAVGARHLGLIDREQAVARARQTLGTVARMRRHQASGMFYNWYDPASGELLRTFPTDGGTIHPFLSSVDNGWLGAGLLTVANDLPEVAGQAWQLLHGMDFGFFYNQQALGPAVPAGQIRGGFWDEQPPGCSVVGNYRGRGPEVWYTCHHYGAFNTEPRIASYLGIALGQIPPAHYFATYRTLPATCDFAWQEQKPLGHEASYLGVPVFEGVYRYRGMQLVPTWGGSMFEALMVPLVVPEESWGPRSWGRNHPLTVAAQIEHGMTEAGYGYWGFSPANNPDGPETYREWGVDAIGMEAGGYTSDLQRTTVDAGFDGCPGRQPKPEPARYGSGVVTPHASFLALRFAPEQALANLDRLRRHFDAYGPGGFYDAVDVTTGRVSRSYLALDQGMVMAALTNALHHDVLREAFTRGPVSVLRPLMRMEDWSDVHGRA